MFRVSIVEDNAADFQQLQEFLCRYEAENGCSFIIRHFKDAMSFLDDYPSDSDMVLMDIEMPQMDGMTAARKLREFDTSVCLIFITNLAQYAINGYQVNALDYLLKPIQYFPLSLCIKKAVHICGLWKERSIPVKAGGSLVRLTLDQITYIESEKHYVTFHTRTGLLRSRGTIHEMMRLLPEETFAQCHASFLVNLAYARQVERKRILVDNQWLPVSRSCCQNLMDAFTRYLGGHC